MDVKKMFSVAGTTLNRIIQQAEEAFLDIPRTEYNSQYKENVKKVDFLILLTEKMITDFEKFLQTNEESSGEVKLMDNVMDPIDKFTYLEEFGMILQNPFEETKSYCPLLYKNLLKVGKYQIKLGETFKAYLKNEGEIYMKKLRKMLDVDLKRFKDEEANLENLRLDHDYSKNRMENTYTQLGRDAYEIEYKKVKINFECCLEKTTELFKTVDSYFTTHRILLKEFVEIQRNYYRDCDKYLTALLRKMYTGTGKENDLSIQPKIISTECKVNSDVFENGDEIGKVNLNISMEEPKPLSIGEREIVTPLMMESENTAIEINDENTIGTNLGTELSGKIDLNQNEIKTDNLDLSLTSSIDVNLETNVNLENVGEFKESLDTEPAIISVSTNLENLIPDSSINEGLSIDIKSESNLDINANLDQNLSDEVIQPVININLENTTPEISVSVQNDSELKQNLETINTEGNISIEPLTIDTNLEVEISEPNLTLNINPKENRIQPEIDSNLENTKSELSLNLSTDSVSNANLNVNLTENVDNDISTESTKLDINMEIETSLQDSLEPNKLEGDISLGSITSDSNIRIANNVPDLPLDVKKSLTEDSNATQVELSIVEPPKIETISELDAKEVLISDDSLSLNLEKSDLTKNIEISESVTENIDGKTEINVELSSEPIKSEIVQNNENLTVDLKLEDGLSIGIDTTIPDISLNNENKDIENKSELNKESSVENADLINSVKASETMINIEPYKVETESSINLKTEIDINLESRVEETAKIEETSKSENDQDTNDEKNGQIETESNVEEKTVTPEEIKTESDKINDQEGK